MKTVVLGAGAVGCLFGGLLGKVGHDVTLVARGDNLKALSESGLRIRNSQGTTTVRIPTVGRPEEVEKCDLCILSVKARDNDILNNATHLKRRGAIFISLQNVMQKEETLSNYFGDRNVLGAVTNVGATVIRPGVIDFTERDHTFLGEYPVGSSKRVKDLADELNRAGLPTHVSENIIQVKWVKLVWIAATGAVAAITKCSAPRLYEDENRTRIIAQMIREGAEVMLAGGIQLRDYPGIGFTPILEADLSTAMRKLGEKGARMREAGVRDMKPSMMQDVMSRRKTEADQQLGFLINTARDLGVAVPTINIVYSIMRGIESGYLSPPINRR